MKWQTMITRGVKSTCEAKMFSFLIISLTFSTALSNMMSDAMRPTSDNSESVTDDEILLEYFGNNNGLHSWTQMDDPVMGGQSTGTFQVEDNAGVMQGHVAIVPFLQAPGFIKAETSPGEAWPDISSCTGMRIHARARGGNYTGYRVSFGRQHPPNGFPYSYGYKTDLHLSGAATTTEMEDVLLDFRDFSLDWDEATGDQRTTCAENPDNCPSTEALQNIYSIALWAEGVEGDVHLEVASIHAVGCDKSTSTNNEASAPSEGEITPKTNYGDEIIIENFADSRLSWNTLNDPVMGGQSDSQASFEDDVAIFTGHVRIVPSLQAPGFITLVNRGGIYPDVSSCNALKLVVKANEAYTGYYVSFGSAHADGGRYAFGFKTPFDAPVGDDFTSIVLPFSSFSDNWDDATGHIKVSCEDDSKYCPDSTTLENFGTMSIWAEGVVGTIHLVVQSISAVGCTADPHASYPSESLSTTITSQYHVNNVTHRIWITALGIAFAACAVGLSMYVRNQYVISKDQYGKIENDLHLQAEKGSFV